MIRRHDLENSRSECELMEGDEGDWVSYEDHVAEVARLKAELEEAKEALYWANEELGSYE